MMDQARISGSTDKGATMMNLPSQVDLECKEEIAGEFFPIYFKYFQIPFPEYLSYLLLRQRLWDMFLSC